MKPWIDRPTLTSEVKYSPRIINLIAFPMFHDTSRMRTGLHLRLKMLSCGPACTESVTELQAWVGVYDPLGGLRQVRQMVPINLYRTEIRTNKLCVRPLFMTYMPIYMGWLKLSLTITNNYKTVYAPLHYRYYWTLPLISRSGSLMIHQLLCIMVNINVMHIIKCLLSKLKFPYMFATLVLSQPLNVSLLTF